MDDRTNDILMSLTSEVSRLSALVERSLLADDDKEKRIRKVERWMYALPVAYVLTLGTVFTTVAKTIVA